MRRAIALSLLLVCTACARFPQTPEPAGTRLVFTLVTEAPVRTGLDPGDGGTPYIYMVALRPSEDPNPAAQGPIPVVAPPWGNGFVAGGCTHFVWWDPAQASEFTLYQFLNPDLQQWFPLGVPVNFERVRPGAHRITFELDLRQLAPSLEDAARLQSLQVNFLTMDRVPVAGTSKFWDAIGDGRLAAEVNTFLTIPLNVSATYDNARAGMIEPEGDTPDPALDIVDWSVEVRRQ
jgi:hypothetical protein